MKIQIVSDLHLEFYENREWIMMNPIIPEGDVLLLAGDIVCDKYQEKAGFFYEKVLADFPYAIATMGNHEFYHGTIDYAYPSYKSKMTENFIRLNNQSYIIGEVKFIVSILWSHVPDKNKELVSQRINDYEWISHKNIHGDKYPLLVDDTNMYHAQSVQYITNELVKPFTGKIVIMTHHLPSFDCITRSKKKYKLNCAYTTDLNALIMSHPNIKYWVCGHSHDFQKTVIGETTVVRNPLGYVEENQQIDFNRSLVIEV